MNAAELLASLRFVPIDRACRRFCPDAHETFTRDFESGVGTTEVHHLTPLDCAKALTEAGVTRDQICRSFS